MERPHSRAISSEGGHTDFGPRNETEIELLRFLQRKYNGRISYERVVSGMGLTNIYDFCATARASKSPSGSRNKLPRHTMEMR